MCACYVCWRLESGSSFVFCKISVGFGWRELPAEVAFMYISNEHVMHLQVITLSSFQRSHKSSQDDRILSGRVVYQGTNYNPVKYGCISEIRKQDAFYLPSSLTFNTCVIS